MQAHRTRAALWIMLVGTQLGCSALLGRRPTAEDWDAKARPSTEACTHVGPIPYIEAGVATTNLLLGIAALLHNPLTPGRSTPWDRTVYPAFGGAGIATAIGWGASAWYGFDVNEACERYDRALTAGDVAATTPAWAR